MIVTESERMMQGWKKSLFGWKTMVIMVNFSANYVLSPFLLKSTTCKSMKRTAKHQICRVFGAFSVFFETVSVWLLIFHLCSLQNSIWIL